MNARAVKWIRRYLRMELRDLVAEGSIGLQAGLTTASDGISPMATAGQFATIEELAKDAYRRGGRIAVEDLVGDVRALAHAGELDGAPEDEDPLAGGTVEVEIDVGVVINRLRRESCASMQRVFKR